MKSLSFFLFLLIVGNTAAKAQSMLKVRLADNSVINIAIDDRYFNKKGTSVTMGDLPAGRHRLTIYAVQQTRNGRGHEEVVYSGKIVTHEGNITLFTYDAYNQQTDEQEQDMNSYTQNNPPPASNNYNNNMPPQGNSYGYDSRNQYANRNPMVAATLTDVKIDQLKTRVMDKKTDTERMKLMKDALSSEKMTTDQVSTMMDWYNFEDSKVEFAKWAYPNTVDQANFPSLENKLTYKDYVDNLDNFIKGNMK